jgi:hypothetical protein
MNGPSGLATERLKVASVTGWCVQTLDAIE